MSMVRDEEVVLEAKALLRETIERSGWYPVMDERERRQRIETDVELHWHLMASDARRRLEARISGIR
ncbi:hypothetical protein [Microvirga sp. BSC39]|uniref:hypothetical protein n=1 Tax=Microvirga sp. BSC39 TaxID=1549810 RepID=UPI0004E90929|nr:hypothetical protein [Microvirga sp. BSC39]KFG66733.1 hypothetical protein JH26_25630 [Microvirga sp. BSC39]